MNPTDDEILAAWKTVQLSALEGIKIDSTDILVEKILAGIDATLGAPWIVQKFISEDARRMLRAQRNYWQNAPQAELNQMLELYNREP